MQDAFWRLRWWPCRRSAAIGEARAQALPGWKIADICAKESAPGQCAAFEGRALKAVSASWPFVLDPIKQACLAQAEIAARSELAPAVGMHRRRDHQGSGQGLPCKRPRRRPSRYRRPSRPRRLRRCRLRPPTRHRLPRRPRRPQRRRRRSRRSSSRVFG